MKKSCCKCLFRYFLISFRVLDNKTILQNFVQFYSFQCEYIIIYSPLSFVVSDWQCRRKFVCAEININVSCVHVIKILVLLFLRVPNFCGDNVSIINFSIPNWFCTGEACMLCNM